MDENKAPNINEEKKEEEIGDDEAKAKLKTVTRHRSSSVTHDDIGSKVRPQFSLSPVTLYEHYQEEVPPVLIACVELLKKDLMKEGIFRIPGRLTKILEMKIKFEQGENLIEENEEVDTHAVAGLLSQFFRELPEPLLTYALYPQFIASVSQENEEDRINGIRDLSHALPKPNYYILKFFIDFLALIAKHSGANRMGVRNLALVFGASLLNPPPHDSYDLNSIKLQCSVIEILISNYAYIFEGEERENKLTLNIKTVATIPAGNVNSPRMNIPTSASSPSLSNFTPKKNSLFKRKPLSSQSTRSVKSMLNLNVPKSEKKKEKPKKTLAKSITDKLKKEFPALDSPRRSKENLREFESFDELSSDDLSSDDLEE